MKNKTYCLGVDVSRYDPQVDWKLLAKEGVDFAIVKLTQSDDWKDPLAEAHLKGATEAGLTTGIYHWCDPMTPAAAQVQHIVRCGYNLPWQFLCLDVEQFEYQAAFTIRKPGGKHGKPAASKRMVRPVRIADTRISQTTRTMVKLLKPEYPHKQIVIYTRVSFLLEYARPMLTWIHEVPLWLAQYPDAGAFGPITKWSDLKRFVKQKLTSPVLPQGCDKWHFWQFSGDRIQLPGCPSRLDLNVFNGNKADLLQFATSTAGKEK